MAKKANSHPKASGHVSMRERSTMLTMYVDPPAAKALKRYAVENDAKVHDLLIEAVEDWFRGHDLKEPVRVT